MLQPDLCPVCTLNCMLAGNCTVTIITKDKFSKERIPNADVIIEDTVGKIIKTGKSNVYGAVIFEAILFDNYTIKGTGFVVELESNVISKNDFLYCKANGKPIEKELFYGNENFILEGKLLSVIQLY